MQSTPSMLGKRKLSGMYNLQHSLTNCNWKKEKRKRKEKEKEKKKKKNGKREKEKEKRKRKKNVKITHLQIKRKTTTTKRCNLEIEQYYFFGSSLAIKELKQWPEILGNLIKIKKKGQDKISIDIIYKNQKIAGEGHNRGNVSP